MPQCLNMYCGDNNICQFDRKRERARRPCDVGSIDVDVELEQLRLQLRKRELSAVPALSSAIRRQATVNEGNRSLILSIPSLEFHC